MSSIHVNSSLASVLALQRQAYFAHPVPTLEERKADLRTLQRFIRDHKDALCDAISADYGHRSRHETLLAEIFPAVDGVDHALKHLRGWMKTQRRAVDWRNFFGASNKVIPQPLGVVGVIVPWNFPVNLSLVPLTYIFAAGNRAMVKMSENSRHLARLLIEKMPAYFPPEKLQFFDETGGVGIQFSKLPFDHLLFTGSGQTGRAVMTAAAQNLCPVTLELGGKAPAVVCEDFPLRLAAERILFVKYLNAGQICTTVDHAWLPSSRVDEFVRHAREIVPARYPRLDSPDFTSIIDQRSFDRLLHALDDARERGAQVIPLLDGPAFDAATRKIAPHIVLNAPDDSALMQREIFGPILPLRAIPIWPRWSKASCRAAAAGALPVQLRQGPAADAAGPGDVGRGVDQRRLVPCGPARPAVRRHRRLGHGPLPRRRRVHDVFKLPVVSRARFSSLFSLPPTKLRRSRC